MTCSSSRWQFKLHHTKTKFEIALRFAFVLTLGWYVVAKAQDERLRLVRADELVSEKVDGKTIRRLVGHVKFVQGEAELTCDRATQLVDDKQVLLEGRVRIYDGQRTLLADRVRYFEEFRKEVAQGHVRIIRGEQTLKATEVTYLEDEEKAIARGTVEMVDGQNRLRLTSGYLEYRRPEEYAYATSQPVLVKQDSASTEALTLRGTEMELFKGGQRALVKGLVEITKGKMKAQCEEAEYLDERHELILRKEPVAYQGYDVLKGKEIRIYFENMKVVKARVFEGAEVLSKVDTTGKDPRVNTMTGREMTLLLQDERIREVIVQGTATSLYHLIEDGQDKGINTVLGDLIHLYIDQGEVKRLRIESSPGRSAGIYYPAGYKGAPALPK